MARVSVTNDKSSCPVTRQRRSASYSRAKLEAGGSQTRRYGISMARKLIAAAVLEDCVNFGGDYS
jgi:hypothetical protein